MITSPFQLCLIRYWCDPSVDFIVTPTRAPDQFDDCKSDSRFDGSSFQGFFAFHSGLWLLGFSLLPELCSRSVFGPTGRGIA